MTDISPPAAPSEPAATFDVSKGSKNHSCEQRFREIAREEYAKLLSRLDSPAPKEPASEARRYTWLAAQKPNSLHLSYNDHASNYVSVKVWIEEYVPDWFEDTPADLLEQMKQTGSIWQLMIYPNTPIGSYSWYGPTLESVIDQAMAWDKGRT
jgi:hypothetical protein